MPTIHTLQRGVRPAARRGPLVFAAVATVLVVACGGNASPTATVKPAATASPAPTATPGPAGVQATLTGDAGVTGPLVLGTVHFVTCDSPSLSGETILAFESATDASIGVLLTIRASTIEVRLARGSGTAYTQRIFDGTGVTSFNPLSGATFSSSVTESAQSGENKGTIGTISMISGSVSCGSFTTGSATITVTGDTAAGSVSGALTSVRVLCGTNTAGGFVTVSGLSHAGSTPVLVSLVGGYAANTPFFVVMQTASTGYQYTSATPGVVTLANGHATYNGTAKETSTSPSAAGRTVTVSGNATCGSNAS